MSNKNDKNQAPDPTWPIFIRRPDLTEDSFYYQGAKKTSGRELLRHFCAAHDHGVFPPETIINELYKLFSSYLEDNTAGKNRRLGEYFGEPPAGTPAASFKKEAVEGIMDIACDHVHRLRLWFKWHQLVNPFVF